MYLITPGRSSAWRIALLLLAPFWAAAQNVIVSPEVTLRNDLNYELFAGPEGQTVLYRDQSGTVTLEAFGPEMQPIWDRELELDKSRPDPLGALAVNGEVTVFYTHRKDRGLYLKLQRYSDRGNLSDSLTVTELDGDFLTPNYTLYRDQASEYAVFVHQRDATTYLVLSVEAKSGRVRYAKKVEFEDGGVLGREEDEIYIDDFGSVYIWKQIDNRRSRLEDHTLKILQLDPDGEPTVATVALPEYLVYDLTLSVDPRNKKVVAAGYYTDNPDVATGVLVISLGYELRGSAEISATPFTPELIASVDQRSRNPEGIPDLTALDMVFRRDGGVLLIGEQRKTTIRSVGSGRNYFGNSLKTDYLYEDIVLSSVNPDGTHHWDEVLPKKQFSQDDGGAFSGYFLATSPERVRLIYNDEVRSGGTVSEYVLSGIGAIERHSLMNTEYQDLWLRHEAGVQLGARAVVIPSERRGRLRLVRVAF